MLPPELLAPVHHISFGVFNLAVPDIIAWITVIVVFIAAAWVRLPKFFEPKP